MKSLYIFYVCVCVCVITFFSVSVKPLPGLEFTHLSQHMSVIFPTTAWICNVCTCVRVNIIYALEQHNVYIESTPWGGYD